MQIFDFTSLQQGLLETEIEGRKFSQNMKFMKEVPTSTIFLQKRITNVLQTFYTIYLVIIPS